MNLILLLHKAGMYKKVFRLKITAYYLLIMNIVNKQLRAYADLKRILK